MRLLYTIIPSYTRASPQTIQWCTHAHSGAREHRRRRRAMITNHNNCIYIWCESAYFCAQRLLRAWGVAVVFGPGSNGPSALSGGSTRAGRQARMGALAIIYLVCVYG